MTANDVRTRIWAVDTIGQYFTRVDSITAHCSIIIYKSIIITRLYTDKILLCLFVIKIMLRKQK